MQNSIIVKSLVHQLTSPLTLSDIVLTTLELSAVVLLSANNWAKHFSEYNVFNKEEQ